MTRPAKPRPKPCRVLRVKILHGDREIDSSDWDDEKQAIEHAKFIVTHGFLGAGGLLQGCEAEIAIVYRADRD